MVGVEPEVNPQSVREAAQHEAGADQQHDRQRNLKDEQSAAGGQSARAPTACQPPCRIALHHRTEIQARRLKSRNEPEQEPGRQRESHREHKGRGIAQIDPFDSHPSDERRGRAELPIGLQECERLDAPRRDEHGQHASEKAEQDGFGHHVTDERGPTGADRKPDGDLALPSHGAAQHEAGQIGARNQQDEADGAQQDQQGSSNRRVDLRLGEGCRHAAPRRTRRVVTGAVAGECLLHSTNDHLQIRVRRRRRDLGFAARDDIQPVGHAHAQSSGIVHEGRGQGRYRHPELRGPGLPAKVRGSDAHDRHDLPIHADRAADDRRIGGEHALPQTLRDHGDRVRIRLVVVNRTNRPAHQGRNAEHRKVPARHDFRFDALGVADGREVDVAWNEALNRAERGRTGS